MSSEDFVQRFGGVYEHSPWVAERAAAHLGKTMDYDQIAALMADCVDNASREAQLALIRAHPDLAGKAQLASDLTAASSDEQQSAGLDRCTPEEYERFHVLNGQYRKKFGFPFVMAVRNRTRAEILKAFAARLENDIELEFENALVEIHKIARMRLEALGLAGNE
ncbi:MAG TPA: 2-oxo-4-hydroxy-4-carboxy-5-ureidoimidazoline decarboxylase [Woeseiaceae bacterium]|nr:2-oxo-4-hydroxy-4-carboxy-5-ureidoimidazoline decarboxylase [Woeseiaceae bacterium]